MSKRDNLLYIEISLSPMEIGSKYSIILALLIPIMPRVCSKRKIICKTINDICSRKKHYINSECVELENLFTLITDILIMNLLFYYKYKFKIDVIFFLYLLHFHLCDYVQIFSRYSFRIIR